MVGGDSTNMATLRRKKVWTKVLVGVAILVILIVIEKSYLFTQYGYHSNKPNLPNLLVGLSNWNKPAPRDMCALPELPNEKAALYGQCRPARPRSDSCSYANTVFGPGHMGKDCRDIQSELMICAESGSFFDDKAVITCDLSPCRGQIEVGEMSSSNGQMNWKKYTSRGEIEKYLDHYSNPFGFVYIRCYSSRTIEESEDSAVRPIQLLLVDLSIPSPSAQINHPSISFNFILLDSVSFRHLQRSLPLTLDFVSGIGSSGEQGAPSVFLYRLFQSIKGRTFENLQALFSGRVPMNSSFGTQDMPSEPLHLEGLYGPLKGKGYSTVFLEDLCWLWEWGLAKDLLVHKKGLEIPQYWARMVEAMRRSSLDSLGISPSSCEILKANGHPDPFHHMPAVCFNGKPQQEYIFDHLRRWQGKMARQHRPFASFYSCNLGHDETGTRIQTLDKTLRDYLQFLVSNQGPDAITFVFSDHGNTYGSFVETMQGRFEMYHPFLLALVPKKVAQVLDPAWLKALRVNQYRLFTFVDLHDTVQSVIRRTLSQGFHRETHTSANVPLGLFGVISPNRTCRDLTIMTPNMCVCEGHESFVTNSSDKAIYAEFALGQLNDRIMAAQRHSNTRRCFRLAATSFENLLENYEEIIIEDGRKEVTTLKFDLIIDLPGMKKKEIFFMTVQHESITSLLSDDVPKATGVFILQSYERVTRYAGFSACKDPDVPLNLCICDHSVSSGSHGNAAQFKQWFTHLNFFGVYSEFVAKELRPKSNCLVLFQRQLGVSLTYELANVCPNSSKMSVVFSVESNLYDVTHQTASVAKVTVEAEEVVYLLSCVLSDWVSVDNIKFKLTFEIL